GAGHFHIEVDPPGIDWPRPETEQAGILVDQRLAGIGFDRKRGMKSEGAISVGGASIRQNAGHQSAVSAIGVRRIEKLADLLEVGVVNGAVAETVAETR